MSSSATGHLDIRAEPADAPAAQALLGGFRAEMEARYGRFDESISPPATPADFAPPGGRFLVLYRDRTPCGCGGIKPFAAGTGELKRMFVVPSARGEGLARLLLRALEDAARDLGCARMRLDTGARQTEARALYPSAGYAPIADYNGNPYAAFWFEKEL